MLVEGWLARAAAARPCRRALETPAGSWSYAQLYAAARDGARALSTLGVGQGDRVAIALPPGLAFAQALHACLLRGAVAVPLDLRAPASERARHAAGAEIVLEQPLGAPGEPTAAGEPDLGHDLDRVAVVIHTSGTTSAARAVELTYGNFLWSALGSAVALGLDPRERWLCAMPLSHVGGLSILLRSAIYATTAVVHERFETDRVLDALCARDITLVSLVATTLRRLLDAGLSDPPGLRCALTGGGPVPSSLLQRARAAGVPVGLTYGLTEACSQVTTTPAASLGEEAGPPLFCTRVRIERERADAVQGADARKRGAVEAGAEAAQGEILVAGPTVAPASLRADGWLATGDVGWIDERGHLRVGGRIQDTIVSGGENVAPAEVEAVLEAHPSVLEAAVVGRPDEEWGEAVSAWVVSRPGTRVEIAELRAHCAHSLASYKVPKEYTLSDHPLPRTRAGKLLRRELR